MLFTHHVKLRDNLPLQKNYKELREAILELFLSVKIRTDEEIDEYNKNIFLQEKKDMEKVNGFELVDLVKESVEKLMQMQQESNILSQHKRQNQLTWQSDTLEDLQVVNPIKKPKKVEAELKEEPNCKSPANSL